LRYMFFGTTCICTIFSITKSVSMIC